MKSLVQIMTVFMALALSVITVAEDDKEPSEMKSGELIIVSGVSSNKSTQDSGFTSGSNIPEANLQIPDELKACAERLRTIYNALKRYEKEKGGLPDWLSDLVPDYLTAGMLIWPEDGPQSTPLAPDRHLPCSFGYQYSSSMTLPEGEMSYREFKDKERKIWGDAVPLVRYYIDINKKCLNISFDGRVYMSECAWETEVKPQEGASEILILKDFFVPATTKSDKKTEAAAEPPSVSGQTTKYRIPEQNLDIPDTLKPCAGLLRRIYTALKKYEKENDRMPDWLSDLVPGYLEAETLFCPDDKSHKSSYWPDPELPCSYCYELNPTQLGGRPPLDKTMLHYKTLQRGLFGDVVPIVRCFHHGRVLNLAWDGRIYTSPIWFEKLFIPNYSHRMLLEVRPGKPAAPRGRTETLAVPESKVLAFDDFDGKLGLKWDIINPNLSNFSLTKKSGALTIRTKKGHFSKDNRKYENVFLIETPVTNDKNFQITTCVSSFEPRACWNEAGIVCWDDEDNYVKLVYEWAGALAFTVGHEVGGVDSYTYTKAPPDIEKIWLRITKRGSSYECSTSTDGKSFAVRHSVTWKKDSPGKVGLFANNGSFWFGPVPDLDASFDFFEVSTVPPKPTAVAVATKPNEVVVVTRPPGAVITTKPTAVRPGSQKFAIPQANLEIPDEMKPCSENLQKIHEALEQYKTDKGELPGFLSDLVPDYLGKEALLCPTHPSERPPLIPDPKLPCSYGYQYSKTPFSSLVGKTQRQWKDAQRRICGDVVPLVRCYGHGQCLNLSFDGRIYISSLVWERDFDPEGGALRQSASPSQSGTTQPSTTPVQRGEGGVSFEEDLEAFFLEVDNTYPFFDLKGIRNDWEQTKKELRRQIKACESDEQFLEIATKAVLCLRDSHMWFRNAKAALPQWPPKYYPGISFMPAAEGRVVIMAGREELNPNLKAGTIVVKIDGQDARRYLEDRAKVRWDEGGISGPQRARLFAYRIPLRSENKGQKHTLTLIVEGRQVDIELTSDVEARGWPHWYNRPENLKQVGSCAYTKLPSGVVYIYLRRVDGTTGPGMKEAFAAYDDAKGWVIDLRGNGGGGYDQALYEVLKVLPQPLAVIIDAGCTSAGETLTRDLVRYANARLFGSPTAGSSSAKRTWSFPSGIATLSLPSRSRWGISGQPIEFNGIRPDENVEAVPEEVQRGLNSAILRAEQYLVKVTDAETR
jgi:regulation of enolase protein 1 (concanavalin A-like superfamily)